MRSGWRWAVLAIALLLALASMASSEDPDARRVPGSTFAAGSEGAKALYLLLRRDGQLVSRRRALNNEEFLTEGTLWILTDSPVTGLVAAELRDLAKSGRSIVGSPAALAPVLSLSGIKKLDGEPFSGSVQGIGKESIDSLEPLALSASSPPNEWLAGLPGGPPVVASWNIGKGRAVVVGAIDIARNDRIGLADNGLFLVHLARKLGGPQVFDEVRTGLGDTGLLSLLARVPYRFAFLQIFLALCTLAAAAWPRRLAAEPPPALRRRTTIEHLEAVARFWSRAKDPGLPTTELAAALDDRARRRGASGPTPFVAWVARVRPELSTKAQLTWDRVQAAALGTDAEAAREGITDLMNLESEMLRW